MQCCYAQQFYDYYNIDTIRTYKRSVASIATLPWNSLDSGIVFHGQLRWKQGTLSLASEYNVYSVWILYHSIVPQSIDTHLCTEKAPAKWNWRLASLASSQSLFPFRLPLGREIVTGNIGGGGGGGEAVDFRYVTIHVTGTLLGVVSDVSVRRYRQPWKAIVLS